MAFSSTTRCGAPLQYSWFSHTQSNDEAMQRVDQYDAIARRAQAVYEQLPTARKDAFFELVLYPVQCASLMNRKVIFADKSTRHGSEGRACASEDAAKARAAAARIIELTDHYNTGLVTVSNKWNQMMSPAPGPWGAQFRQFDMPPLSDYAGAGPPALGVALEGGNPQTLADLSVYTQGKRFVDLYNTGKGEIRWSATPSQPWLRLDLTSGTFATEQRLWVSVDWGCVPASEALTAAVEVDSSDAGATVVGPNPARDPGLKYYPQCDVDVRKLADEVWGNCDGEKVRERRYGKGRIFWGKLLREILQADGVPPDFDCKGTDSKTFLDFIHRRTGEADIYFVCNRSNRSASAEVAFRVDGKQPELWDAVTGEMRPAAAFGQDAGRTIVPL